MSNDSRVFSKLDKIEEKLVSIDKTLVRNTVSLEHHIERTNQNEEMIKLLRKDMEPLKVFKNNLQGVLKALTYLSVCLAIVTYILKLFGVV